MRLRRKSWRGRRGRCVECGRGGRIAFAGNTFERVPQGPMRLVNEASMLFSPLPLHPPVLLIPILLVEVVEGPIRAVQQPREDVQLLGDVGRHVGRRTARSCSREQMRPRVSLENVKRGWRETGGCAHAICTV